MTGDMILSVSEALEVCSDIEAMVDMKLITSAEAVVIQADVMARVVPLGATS